MALRVILLSINPQVLHEREVLDRKQNGRLPAEVGVLVPEVRRHNEEVAGAPLIDTASDNTLA